MIIPGKLIQDAEAALETLRLAQTSGATGHASSAAAWLEQIAIDMRKHIEFTKP